MSRSAPWRAAKFNRWKRTQWNTATRIWRYRTLHVKISKRRIVLRISEIGKIFLKRSSSTNLQIDSLDGLRGIAVLIVILAHMKLHIGPVLDLRRGAGHYGVYLFFVLSSFLLTLPILQRPVSQFVDIGLWLRYSARRFLRIFPPYIAVLLINCLCSSLLSLPHFAPLSAKEVVWHMALRIGYNVFWTIPVEFKYYFVLPIVGLLLVIVLRKRIFIVLFFIGACICTVGLILWPFSEAKTGGVPLWPYLPIFLMGSSSALLHHELAKVKRLKSFHWKIVFEGFSVITLLLVFILIPSHRSLWAGKYAGFFSYTRDSLLIGLLWSLFTCFYLNGIGILRKILESSFLRFTGIVSFSAYLWHVPIISFMRKNMAAPVVGSLLIIAATLAIAALSHILIERPFMKFDPTKYLSKVGLSPSNRH